MSDRTNQGGVHRLSDMVVEEVSLVDHAANKHRFLLVKRDEAMATQTKAEGDLPVVEEGSPLGLAIAALENLTAAVELLGDASDDEANQQIMELANELRETVDQLLAQAAPGDAEKSSVPPAPEKPDGAKLATQLETAKAAISRLAGAIGKAGVTESPTPENPAVPTVDLGPLQVSLDKLETSFRTLAESVKDQQQRLGRVEKQFGLPDGAAPAEELAKKAPTDAEVGWPLDLNDPYDRESVDKAISFHDP